MKKSAAKKEWLEVFDSDSDFESDSPPPRATKQGKKDGSKQAKKDSTSTPKVPVKTETPKSAHVPYMAEYVLEKAKSGRAECKKCNLKIAKDELRVGVIVQGDRWVSTNWQHVQCTIFPPTMQVCETISGFCSLSPDQQQLIRERLTSSMHEVDPDNIPIDPNELVRKTWSQAMEPVNELLMPLLPYQKEGLGWMVNQEKSAVRGGILADEMGMGKTIQAIGLILANRPDACNSVQQRLRQQTEREHQQLMAQAPPESNPILTKFPGSSSPRSSASNSRGGQQKQMSRGFTLVVVPTVALRQWQAEILRFTQEGALNIAVYHGTTRGQLTQRMLMRADVVLTTYKILELEFRKATALSKMACSVCGKKYYPEKYRLHRKYYCGDDAQQTAAQSKTQVKRRGGWGARSGQTVGDVISDDSDSSSEDEIDRQKKMIKAMKEKDKAKGKTITKTKSKAKTGGADKKRTVAVESESEDEIDRQKKMIKAMKEKERAKGGKVASTKNCRPTVCTSKNSSGSRKKPTKTPAKKKKRGASESGSEYEDESSSKSESEESSYADSDGGSKKRKRAPRDTPTAAAKRGSAKTKAVVLSKKEQKKELEKNQAEVHKSGSGSSGKTVKSKKAAPAKKGKKSKQADGSGNDSFASDSSNSDGGDGDELNPEVEYEIAQAMKRSTRQVVPSLLHAVSWFRIILDEAHLIKDRSSSTAKAVFHLTSLHKWCLTGTPLQNRVGELFSLVRFLRLDPHSFYYCRTKGCDCKSLHYKFTKGRCDDCSHTAMQHFSHFNKHILNPIKRKGYIGEGRKGMLTLKNEILDEVLLRRTKNTRADDIQLPPRIVRVRMDALDPFEEDFYEAMYTQSQAQFNTYVEAGTILNNYAHIFDILIRLRQVVDHPYLVLNSTTKPATVGGVTYGANGVPKTLSEMDSEVTGGGSDHEGFGRRRSTRNSASARSGGANKQEEEEEDEVVELCGFCHEPPSLPVRAHCSHVFCESCVTDYLQVLEEHDNDNSTALATSVSASASASSAVCPICSEPLSLLFANQNASTLSHAKENTFYPSSQASGSTLGTNHSTLSKKNFVNMLDLSNFQSSTKLEALMQELYMMRQRDYGAKAIVFSQFVNMLDLTEYRLQRGGFKCGKLTGSLSVDQRDKIIQSFSTEPDMNVLLISLKAGGVALNLTAANHIFIMDPWWNPAAEMQAIDRTHRIGQHKPIHATRFIIQNTIEERILHLQEKKRLVFDGTIGGDAGAMARLSVEDMRFLFQ